MLSKILIFIGISVLIYGGIAVGLILSQRPKPLSHAGGLAFEKIMSTGAQTVPVERSTYLANDGAELPMTWVHEPGSETKPLVVMVHGSGWHGGQFDALAYALRDLAEVKAVTLRGHGEAPERRGDVDYVGQLEDDVAGLFEGQEDRRKILLGHSSGGGLAVRFAGGEHGDLIDGMILLAPFLQYDAATTRPNSGGWAFPLTRRIIGLSMLNQVGIHAFDSLPMIQFNMPKSVLDGPQGRFATTAYSWRMNLSYAPRRDYLADIAALPNFLLITGAQDEAMDANAYEPLMSEVTSMGQYHIVPSAAHLDIVEHADTLAIIRAALQ